MRPSRSVPSPSGYVARANVRPVETNTIYHVLPGARALTFGMYGCDLRCPYCHNWYVTQALRERDSREAPSDISAEALVEHAVAEGCRVICATYNEPAIAAEWVHEIFRRAKTRGLVTSLVTDGNASPSCSRISVPSRTCIGSISRATPRSSTELWGEGSRQSSR